MRKAVAAVYTVDRLGEKAAGEDEVTQEWDGKLNILVLNIHPQEATLEDYAKAGGEAYRRLISERHPNLAGRRYDVKVWTEKPIMEVDSWVCAFCLTGLNIGTQKLVTDGKGKLLGHLIDTEHLLSIIQPERNEDELVQKLLLEEVNKEEKPELTYSWWLKTGFLLTPIRSH